MAYESPETKSDATEDDVFRQLLTDAISYIDEELSPERAKATDYYFGRKFGNEQEGRSQVILTEVRDAVEQTLPSIMRLIFGPEHVVEFVPDSPEAVELAKEATDYIRYVFEHDNDGFGITMDVLKDGLVRKLGVYKWGWEDYEKVEHYSVTNIDNDALILLIEDETIEIEDIRETADGLLDVDVKVTKRDGCAKFWAVPPEEFVYNRNARSRDDALLIAHRTRKTRAELIEMGISEKDIDEHGGDDTALRDNEEVIARDPYAHSVGGEEPLSKDAEGILYIESYTRIYKNELRRVCTIGPMHYVVKNEACDEVPFSDFCPVPEPHTMSGQSLADLTMDLQLTKSNVMRAMLDSAAASIFSRIWYKEGDANLQDVLNTEIGAPIRTRSGGNAVGVFAHPFLGKDLLGVLGYFDEIKESRVGRAGGAQGLHMDSMQSSTKAAVAAAVTDAQMRTEMFARIFAERALAPLFRGLLRLYVANQPAPKTVQIGTEWRRIDPRSWNADSKVRVNVMLGSGLTEEKLAMYEAILAQQKEIMATLGPDNPLVGFVEIRNTLDDAIALRGRKDVERYFKPFGPEQAAAMQQAAQNAPKDQQQDPAQVLAQAQIEIEKMKAQQELSVKQAELQMKQQEIASKLEMERQKMALEQEREMFRIRLEDDRARDKASQELALKREEIEAKYAAQVTAAEIKAETDAIRNTSQAGPEA